MNIDFSNLSDFETIYICGIGILLFIWLIFIIRTAKDISARTNSKLLQIVAILLVTILTPIFGIPLYLAIRPVSYKIDRIPRREALITHSAFCKNCGTLNPKEYESCIICGKKIKIKCKECNKEYPHSYHYCPYCGAPNIEA